MCVCVGARVCVCVDVCDHREVQNFTEDFIARLDKLVGWYVHTHEILKYVCMFPCMLVCMRE